jgi:hypothetical protein
MFRKTTWPCPGSFLPALVAAGLLVASAAREVHAAKAEMRELKRDKTLDAGGDKRDKDRDPKGGKPRPEEATARALERLRENLEVTDEAEWAIISARVTAVADARSSLGKAGGGPGQPLKAKPGTRSGSSTHPEQDALRYAVRDKLPDAEVKARLARAHEVHQQNEARLAKAQAELRAVLTVRQEAVAVLAGLLPP